MNELEKQALVNKFKKEIRDNKSLSEIRACKKSGTCRYQNAGLCHSSYNPPCEYLAK